MGRRELPPSGSTPAQIFLFNWKLEPWINFADYTTAYLNSFVLPINFSNRFCTNLLHESRNIPNGGGGAGNEPSAPPGYAVGFVHTMARVSFITSDLLCVRLIDDRK